MPTLERKIAKGCFGQSKYQAAFGKKKVENLRKFRKSASGAAKRGNSSLLKTRSAQITQLQRTVAGRLRSNPRPAMQQLPGGSHRVMSGTRGHR